VGEKGSEKRLKRKLKEIREEVGKEGLVRLIIAC
jgi:hypothetical protein